MSICRSVRREAAMNDRTHKREGYFIQSIRMDPCLDYVKRIQFHQAITRKTDIYSDYWMLYIFDLPRGHLKMRHGRTLIDIVGPRAVFVPPFSPVEWHFAAGWANWTAYYSHAPVARHFPAQPVSFAWDRHKMPAGYQDIADLFASDLALQPVGVIENESAAALRGRLFLNRFFAEQIDIADLAKDLKISYSTMVTAFRSCYGISPLAYRNHLRVFEALKLIGQGRSATDACFASGFADYSRFYRNFTTVMENKPSDFLYGAHNDYHLKQCGGM